MYRLVIIDDEEKIVEGMANLFPWENLGFSVIGRFNESLKALDFILENQADVILTDIEMPGINGLNLIEEVQKGYKPKIVLFSSHQNYTYFRTAIQFGVYDYLLKPIKYEELVTCFEKIRVELDQERGYEINLPKTYYEKLTYTVNEYLKTNYKNASLEEISGQLNMNANYLSKIYKEKSGIGFSDLLLKIRMEKACELLEDIRYKTYEIAYHLGYDNPKNFSRAFKNYYGITPTQYRNRKLDGVSEC